MLCWLVVLILRLHLECLIPICTAVLYLFHQCAYSLLSDAYNEILILLFDFLVRHKPIDVKLGYLIITHIRARFKTLQFL